MSNKNKINEVIEDKKDSSTRKEEDRCNIFNIKSRFIRKNLFDFLKNGNFHEQTNGILKHNHKLHQDRITLPLREKQRIDSLNDVEKWTPYLKYIYWSLGEIANELFDNIRGHEEKHCRIIGEQECIESIVQLLAVNLIFNKVYVEDNGIV